MLGVSTSTTPSCREGTSREGIAWAVYGDPDHGRAPDWTFVFHALTGSQRVHEWWAGQLAPAGPLARQERAVLCANLPGSCHGSAVPTAAVMSPRDIAQALLPLVRQFGIERFSLVTGGSLGGMVALEWLRVSPVPVTRAVILAAPARSSAQVIAWNAVQRMAIEAGGPAGLAAARAAAMITYRSPMELDARFGRGQARVRGRYDAEGWLRHHGDKLVRRFDADAYRRLTHTMDAHDLGDLAMAARETAERCAEVIGVGIDSDQLFPAASVREWVEAYARHGATASYREIESVHGHDAFLLEQAQVARLLAGVDP